MKPEHAKEAVRWLANAWHDGLSLRELPEECRPRDAAEAYRIQDRVAEELGFASAGWKIGATSAAARKILGARGPIAGRIFAGRIFASGVALPASAYRMRGLEAEFAFRLDRDLKPRLKPYSLTEVAGAVDAVVPAIEVVDSRFADWRRAGLRCLIADFSLQAALVLGRPVTRWRDFDLAAHKVRMTVGGKSVGEGTGAAVLGHPLAALRWLANLRRRKGGLKAGEIVSTGTCTGLYFAAPGDVAVAEFGRIGKVAVTLAA